ncbi:MAG: hypothetical protein ACP5OH_03980, partial [Nitrososphaerota archaeon]
MNLFILSASLTLFGLPISSSFSFVFALNQSLTYEDPSLGFKFQYPALWKQILEKDMEGTGVAFSPLPTS